jgi:parallel beta-helix repeat protein
MSSIKGISLETFCVGGRRYTTQEASARASDNVDNGFYLLSGSDGNTLKRNWAIGNSGDGFQLDDSDNNTLEHNWAMFNDGNGFFLVKGSDNNTLERNKALFNDGYGILVDAVMDNLFENNFCLFNGLGGSNQPDIC